MAALILLAFVLGLDSFRVSAGLGGLNLDPSRRRWIALAFGLCDGAASLVGAVAGRSVLAAAGRWTAVLGPVVLFGYGCYVLYLAWRCEELREGSNGMWLVFGIPLALSLDNFVAGVGIGMLELSALVSALVIGMVSGLLSLAGMRLGNVVGQYVPFRAELLGGLALICMALILALD
jgi:manganese efflux pump family protein